MDEGFYYGEEKHQVMFGTGSSTISAPSMSSSTDVQTLKDDLNLYLVNIQKDISDIQEILRKLHKENTSLYETLSNLDTQILQFDKIEYV